MRRVWSMLMVISAVFALDLTVVEKYPPDDLQPLVFYNGSILFKADSALDQVLYSDQGLTLTELSESSETDPAEGEIGLVQVDCSIVSFLVAKLGGIFGDKERLLLLCSDGLKMSDGVEVELITYLHAGNIFRPHFLAMVNGVVYLIHDSNVYFLDPQTGKLLRAITGGHTVRLPNFLKYPGLINARSRSSHKFLLTVLPQAGISVLTDDKEDSLLYPDSLCSVYSFTPTAGFNASNISASLTSGSYGTETMLFSALLDLECMKFNQESLCKMKSYWCSWDASIHKCMPNECFATAISGDAAAFSFRLYTSPFDNRDAYVSDSGVVFFPIEGQQINSMTRTSTGDIIFITESFSVIGGKDRQVIRGPPATFIDHLEHIIEVSVSATDADWYLIRYVYSSKERVYCAAFLSKGFNNKFIPIDVPFSVSTSSFGIPGTDDLLPPQATYAHGRVYFWFHLPSQSFSGESKKERLELWSSGVVGGVMSKKPILHYTACDGVCDSKIGSSMLVLKQIESKLVVVLPRGSNSPGKYEFFSIPEKLIIRDIIDPDYMHWSIFAEGISTLIIILSATACVRTSKKIETEAYLSPATKPSTKVELKLKSFYQRAPNFTGKGKTVMDEQLAAHPAGTAQQKEIWDNIPTITSFQTEESRMRSMQELWQRQQRINSGNHLNASI